ncbi:ABC transporter ATP-binding protein [Kingella negevensis]|uniref:ABC transporter ATP-binding protein n=1 Tax=Kingella negevensis TaxID=1522312 RepID=UPI002542BA3B|nr:ABC transporter ATP-binding protein [Kingella negevensis]WII93984.1 ABC transporter ATP-binding protein [Kingella negevensis]
MLELININKSFNHKTVAQNISFQVPAGSITSVLGASGSGKSTLLNIITGLLPADSGEVRLNGALQNHLQPEKRHIAMMFQDFALLPHLNVWQNAAFGLRMRGASKKITRETVLSLLDEVGLAAAAERRIDALSGGEKQRVALARALAGEPKLLLLDEPFSSLDTHLREQLQSLTIELVRRRQIPALLVTHDPAEACALSDKLVLLADGKILQHDTPANVLARPQSMNVAKLLGCLNVNAARYVPPEAIVLADERGVDCAVLSCFRLPLGWRVTVSHPKYGELSCLVGQAFAGETCRVWVDETRIVAFAA